MEIDNAQKVTQEKMTAVNSQTETCFDMTSGGREFLIRRSPSECQSRLIISSAN